MANGNSAPEQPQGGNEQQPPISFAGRADSGPFVTLTRSDIGSPDNQSVDPVISSKFMSHYVNNSLFTGGFNIVTGGHLATDDYNLGRGKVGGNNCAVQGCDGKAIIDELGNEVLPCECDFKICVDCFKDDVRIVGGICPGCREPYKITELDELLGNSQFLALRPLSVEEKNYENSMTITGQQDLIPTRTMIQTGDFDDSRWLFETRGTYGYGNAIQTKENDDDGDNGGNEFDHPWRPLTHKMNITAAIMSPYRFLVLVRFVFLALYLAWRITHKNKDAIWLWGMSVVCEIWFAFTWLLDQFPKIYPIKRETDLAVLKDKFETPKPHNPTGKSDLPGIDVFVSTADPEKEPVLITANTILSVLAVDYPVEKISCYISDDGGSLLTFEAMAETASFANIWVPFCRKHNIEPRSPESYFSLKSDPYKNKVRADFVKDRRRIKREYDEFKVRINGLPDSIRRRSDAFHIREEIKTVNRQRNKTAEDPAEAVKIPKGTWMADGTYWPGTWLHPSPQHSKRDHAGIIQVMLKPPCDEPIYGVNEGMVHLDFSEVDTRLPMLVYVSREKRPGHDHNKKAGAMNALVRVSALMSNGPFMLNLDCDHYVYNSQAFREGICFMMDRGGDRICYVQFPQRFEGIDPCDRYGNHNTIFFDVCMRALDGLQGPMYVGTGCLFRRMAIYGFDPPRVKEQRTGCCCCMPRNKIDSHSEETIALREEDMDFSKLLRKFGNSGLFIDSIPEAEFQGRPIADHPGVKNGRPPGALTITRNILDASTVVEAISVISCWYEAKTEWGHNLGWIYGSVTEDVVTGYRMHNRGWRSVYCVTKPDAFRGTAPINLTDKLHQVLRWATGSVELFFSRNNAIFGTSNLKFLQRIAYLNIWTYPFTSIFLIVYCFLPALSLFSGQFIVQTLSIPFVVCLLIITLTLCLLAFLEIKWSGIDLEDWWRNEQFWVIAGTSAYLVAVLQGLLKVIFGIDISFKLTSKSAGDDADDEFAELYAVKWTSLLIPPMTIIMVNIVAILVGFSRTIYSDNHEWSKLLGGVCFSIWVLAHLYPYAKGLMGRRGRIPTIVFVWSGLIAFSISLLWVAISLPLSSSANSSIGDLFKSP